MCNKGKIMSANRHGINQSNIGPLAKSSFEETTDQLLKASIFGEADNVTGVSSNIMLGQIAPCGTGLCAIILDEEEHFKLYREMKSEHQKAMKEIVEDEDEEDDFGLGSDDDFDDEFNERVAEKPRARFSLNSNDNNKRKGGSKGKGAEAAGGAPAAILPPRASGPGC